MVRRSRAVAALDRARISALTTALVSLALVMAGGWSAPASAAYSTQAAPSWVPNGVVKAMVRSGGTVYLGGSFTALTDPVTGAQVTRNRVAALDAATGAPLPFNPNANGLVDALAVAADGTVYLGGDFTSVGGRTATRLAAVTAQGSRLTGFAASANNTVHDLYVDGAALVLGGRFGAVNGRNRPKLARVDRVSGALTTFNARVAGGRVLTVEPAPDGQSLLVGGDFTTVDGQPRSFVAGVGRETGVVTGWNPGAVCGTCYVFDLATTPGAVYAAVAGPGGRAVAWDAGAGAGLLWSRSGDGNVQAIDVQDGVVYAGGHFGPIFDGATRHQLAALDAGTGALQEYAIAFTGSDQPGIWAVDADADALRIAGGFALAGNPARRYAALPLAPSPG